MGGGRKTHAFHSSDEAGPSKRKRPFAGVHASFWDPRKATLRSGSGSEIWGLTSVDIILW